ncbi:hypothetical protein GF367_02650 [Candidatus Woesearchaeota archaeon]|nr:hypothetical protein [Candidatus Woesearchaeota archaeon]
MALQRIQHRKERRNKILMGAVLSFLMVASGFGVYLSGRGAQGNTVADHGVAFSFDYQTQTYTAKLGDELQQFYYLPSSVAAIHMPDDAASLLRSSSAVIITFDPSLSARNLQLMDLIRFDLSSSLGRPVISAVTNESAMYALPVVACDNATAQVPVLSWEAGEEAAVERQGACLRFIGNQSGFLQLRDRLLYEYYGVYEE